MLKALILAAGKGTRLKHLTANRPKPMLPVGNIPLLEHHLRWLHSHKITEIAINLHHSHSVITDYFGDGRNFGVSIHYSYEETLLGTAGAAKRLEGFLDQPFVVVYGDVFTNLNLQRLLQFHRMKVKNMAPDQTMTLSLYQVPNPTECGLVGLDADGRITRFVEKPPAEQVFTRLANAGVMVCETGILAEIPSETVFDFGADLLPKLLASQAPLFGQEVESDEYVIDIGTQAGYQRACEEWMRAPVNSVRA
jgi:NDP-sugar pyrophosphorylase family protein